MKRLSTYLLLLGTLLGFLAPMSLRAAKADTDRLLREGGIVRLKNRGSNLYITERNSQAQLNQLWGAGKITSTHNNIRLTQLWFIEKVGDKKYTLRNAFSGRYIQAKEGNPITTVAGEQVYYIKYSAANPSSTSDYLTISWKEDFTGKTCLNDNVSTHKILGWLANSASVNDAYSDWSLEPTTEVTLDEIKAHVKSRSKAIEATGDVYVRIINSAYGSVIGGGVSKTSTITECVDENGDDYTQVWKLVPGTTPGTFAIQNAVTDRFIQAKNGVLSTPYTAGTGKPYFPFIQGRDTWITSYAIKDGVANNKDAVLHADQQGKLVGWYNDQAASNWTLEPAQVDEAKLAEQRKKAEDLAFYNWTNAAKVKTTLTKLFEDGACTVLKPEYQAKTDEELREVMNTPATAREIALPEALQTMVLKIKNNTWTYREKEFRVHSYGAYSNPTRWNSNEFVGTGYPFSSQTNPTGVSAKRGDLLFVFLGQRPAQEASIQLLMTRGLDVVGQTKSLQVGFNAIPIDHDCHVFVDYTINNPDRKIADFVAIPVHVEGGFVNGYFDITRGHKNADWADMAKHLFKDEYVHLKSKYAQFNMRLKEVKSCIKEAQLTQVDRDGVPKAIEGALMRWDTLMTWERELMGLEKFDPYFNCMFSASSSSKGNPYASNYGTYYPGISGVLDYNQMTYNTEFNGAGNYWMVAHENGHLHQKAINIAGDTEASVNLFSQVCLFRQGSNVSRGEPWSCPADSFHAGKFYHEYNLITRSRMYFQLWLYYHVMGHKKDFFPTLFKKLRQTPMERTGDAKNPISGWRNYLRFAMFACDVAQEDLSEFFQFYGFFVPLKDYKIGDYSNSYFTTPQEDIDRAIAHMRKYPKKNHSVLFIDDRIRLFPANNPSVDPGTMRVGTTQGVPPAKASVVGDVGMFLDFVANPDTLRYRLTVDKNTGRVKVDPASGKGAVGFKVYDSNHNFVFASNKYNFTIPAKYRQGTYYIAVAWGDGTQSFLYDSLTGISSINAEESAKTDKVYDLSGRPAHTDAKGVHIINRKRVIK